MVKARNGFIKNLRFLYLVGVIVFGLLTIVGSNNGDGIDKIKDSCGTSDLTAISNMDSISEECKQAILGLLPQPENDIQDRLVNLGQGVIDQKMVLFCSGTDDFGEILDSGDTSAIELTGFRGQNVETIDSSQYSIKKFDEFTGILVSFSSIMDYSGSMSDKDIDDGIEIFTDLFKLTTLTERFETDIIIFSDTVKYAMDFSSDIDTISEYIARDSTFGRKSTMLFDAMGTGLNSLSQRESSIRLLIVATDGKENASEEYEKEDIFELSKTNRIPVIILGSLFADLSFLKEVSQETGGFYIYSKTILEVKEDFMELHEMFDKIVGIELSESLSQNLPDSMSISLGGKEIVYTF